MFIIYLIKLKNFINKKKLKQKLQFLMKKIYYLDTGGGILKGNKIFKDEPFFVINPDTLWSNAYY
jgi:NDP-sugar pyrophosphorylase family protein